MIIHDFYVVGIAVTPNKADSPLLIDTNTVLPSSIPFERFEVIPGWRTQIAQLSGDVELAQLSLGYPFKAEKAFHPFAAVKLLRLPRSKGLDHCLGYNEKR